jgi:hypothetical protein
MTTLIIFVVAMLNSILSRGYQLIRKSLLIIQLSISLDFHYKLNPEGREKIDHFSGHTTLRIQIVMHSKSN